MQIQEKKQYLLKRYSIKFVEKTLNSQHGFVRVYGKDFVSQRLEENLDKVYSGEYSLAYKGSYNINDQCITIYSMNRNAKTLTKADIQKNWDLQQTILHECIHAIFKRTKEECEALKIENGTGIKEVYENGTELGRGLNEGLTEWICEKAGYPSLSYENEHKVVKLIELAIGEDAVMQFAKGGIRQNIAQLLQMTEKECVELLSKVDNIYKAGEKIRSTKAIIEALEKRKNKFITEVDEEELRNELGEYYDEYLKGKWEYVKKEQYEKDVNAQLANFCIQLEDWERNLYRTTAWVEEDIFEKYFKDEIEKAQNSEVIDRRTMKRLTKMYNNIQGRDTSGWRESLAQKFKDEIYEQLTLKYQPTILEKLTGERPYEQKKANLPIVLQKGWFQKIKEAINRRFKKKTDSGTIGVEENKSQQNPKGQGKSQEIKEYVRDMSNYSKEPINKPVTILEPEGKYGEQEK